MALPHIPFNKSFFTKTEDYSTLVVNEEYAILAEAIFHLPIKYREIIILYFYEEYMFKEIAALLETPESTIKSRMVKVKQLLKQQLPM